MVLRLRASLQLHASLGLCLALLGGCAMFPQQPAQARTDKTQDLPQTTIAAPSSTSDDPRAAAQYHVLTGEMAAGRQMPAIAAQEFLKALDYAPNAQLAARATALAIAGQREDLALIAARKWLAVEPTSLEAREVLVRLSVRAGDSDEAYQQGLSIVRNHPGGLDDGLRHVALLLAQEPTKGDAGVALMQKLVTQYPKRAGAHAAASLLELRFGKVAEAESEAREALKLNPASRDSAMLLVDALIKQDRVTDADAIVDEQAKGKEAIDVRLGYSRLLLEESQREGARRQLQKVLKLDADNADAHFALGLLELDERKLDAAEAQLKPLTGNAEHRMEANYFLGRIAELRKQPKQALAMYEKVTSGNQALDASLRRATLLARSGRIDDAREIFEQLRRQYPPLASRFYAAEGEVLINAGNDSAALDLYNRALALAPDDSDLLYSRSLAYERLNRIDEAETDLRRILTRNPDDARSLNALGYMLSVHTNRLDEAQKLIGRAYTLNPEDPAIIDSLGWVQFKNGKPKDALPLLQKALSLFPDPEVAAHLGEVLWTLGDRDQALNIWKNAQQADPDNAVLRETVRRLNP